MIRKSKLFFVATMLVVGLQLNTSNALTKCESEAEITTVAFSGIVLDELTGEALPGVKLEVGNLVTYSDFEGKFRVNGLFPGEYQVSAEYISYQQVQTKVQLDVSEKEPVKLKISQLTR